MRKLSMALIVLSLFWIGGLSAAVRVPHVPGTGIAMHGAPAPIVPFGDDSGGSH
jgi:hypothetical protein